VTLAALLVAAPTASGQSGRRLALVVGNDAYRAQSALRNAVNDARAVASALGEVGFAVTRVENANRARLTSALSSFAGSLRDDDVALFYFAGHGVQVDGVNYLMPTDYAGQSSAALRFDAVSASDVQEMLRPARVAMLVFDACRNNPYRGVRGGTGLAPMEARGTLVAYAAGAGEVAADAAPGEANGLFTSKLVEALREPGLTASALFHAGPAGGGGGVERGAVAGGVQQPAGGLRVSAGADRGRRDGRGGRCCGQCDGVAAAGDGVLGNDQGEYGPGGLRGVSGAVREWDVLAAGPEPPGGATAAG